MAEQDNPWEGHAPEVSAWSQLGEPWEMLIQDVFQGIGSPEECPIQSAQCPVAGSEVRTFSMCMNVVCVWLCMRI